MFILKQLRRKKNISQTEFAQIIGVSLRTIQLYEKKGANIPIKNLTKIAQYFDLDIADLYAQERVNEIGAQYETMNSKAKDAHVIKKLAPGKYLVSAPLVMASMYNSYMDNDGDVPFMETLPKISFVIDQVSTARYLAFEISNNSMDNGEVDGIPNRSVVLAKMVSTKKMRTAVRDNPKTLWVIDHKDSIMCKKITDFDTKRGILKCSSLNNSPEYADFEINIEDVRQFYSVIKKQI